MKNLPERLVHKFILSASNGRSVSPKIRRLLTLVVVPIWTLGLIYSLIWFVVGCIEGKKYWFGTFDERYQVGVTYEELLLAVFAPLIYFAICFFIPWTIIRLIFWVKDADKEDGPRIENSYK